MVRYRNTLLTIEDLEAIEDGLTPAPHRPMRTDGMWGASRTTKGKAKA